jgi:hypothetical protein
MAAGTKTTVKIFTYSKYLGLGLIVLGIPAMLLDNSNGSEMPLLVGLFTLLISSNNVEDERSVQIKTTSLYFAFIISYAVKLVTSNLHDHTIITFELVEINHFLILMLALANAVHYGRMYILKH